MNIAVAPVGALYNGICGNFNIEFKFTLQFTTLQKKIKQIKFKLFSNTMSNILKMLGQNPKSNTVSLAIFVLLAFMLFLPL